MSKRNFTFPLALVVGLAIGSLGMYLLASSQAEVLLASSYLRSASDARGYALALSELREQQNAQAISRLEGYLSVALVSLNDYESVIPASKREPQVYEAIAIVRKYVSAHPEVSLPPPVASALTLTAAKNAP